MLAQPAQVFVIEGCEPKITVDAKSVAIMSRAVRLAGGRPVVRPATFLEYVEWAYQVESCLRAPGKPS